MSHSAGRRNFRPGTRRIARDHDLRCERDHKPRALSGRKPLFKAKIARLIVLAHDGITVAVGSRRGDRIKVATALHRGLSLLHNRHKRRYFVLVYSVWKTEQFGPRCPDEGGYTLCSGTCSTATEHENKKPHRAAQRPEMRINYFKLPAYAHPCLVSLARSAAAALSLFRVTDGVPMTTHQMLFVPVGEPSWPPCQP
jgi:hypothetical protein